MAFTEYFFDKELIKKRVEERASNLRTNLGITSLLEFGLGVIADRLKKDKARYRDYGPYWWALKDIMNRSGHDLGSQSDPMVAQVYRGDSDVETLIMADEFRELNLASSIVYNNSFMLDGESGEFWKLYDSDMESK